MKNERYLRISHNKPMGNANSNDDNQNSSIHQFSPWRMRQFQALSQDDDEKCHDTNKNDIDDRDAVFDEEDHDPKPNSGLGESATKVSSLETAPIVTPQSPASSHQGSEGFLDDNDDDLEGLSRYQLDFSDTSLARNVRESLSLEDAVAQGHLSFALLRQAYTQTQEQTRQDRINQLLSATSESEKIWIAASSWCDLYDRGLGLLILMTALWLFLATLLQQHLLTLLGILFFLQRISAKPLYWYLRGRHLARRRKVNMQIYEHVNQLGMELTQNELVNPDHRKFRGEENEEEHVGQDSQLTQDSFVGTVRL
jgi:hypothetical protein